MKTTKIIFWTSTTLIFLFEGLMPALFSQTEMGKEGIRHLGYPAYFGLLVLAFKILGALSLILPMIPARVKEWAYAGFAIEFISASVSHFAVDGFDMQTIFPFFFLGILVISYRSYHKLNASANERLATAKK